MQHSAIDRIESHARRNSIVMPEPLRPEGSITVDRDRISECKCWLDTWLVNAFYYICIFNKSVN